MKERKFEDYNAGPVLDRLNRFIDYGASLPTRQVCNDLSIFDWWTERLSVAQMKQMRTFLTEAIKRGYTGYVCFKVGASGCANGMWAHKVPTTDGYSPDGDFLYRSFTPDYTHWSAKIDGKHFPSEDKWNSCKTAKQLFELIG